MRIAIVTYSLNVGGIETFIQLLADYSRDEGHDVVIIETQKEGSWSKTFRNFGYRVEQIFPSPYRSLARHARKIARKLSEFDVIILNDSPLVQSGLGLLPNTTVAMPVLHSNLTTMLRNATANSDNWDMLVAVSPALQRFAVDFGAAKDKVRCIPNGISVPEKWSKRDCSFNSSQAFRLIYVGAINHIQKGVFYLPDIYSQLIVSNPNIHLDIVGDGPDLNLLKKNFAALDAATVIFHGKLSNQEVLSLLEQADALIMPSHFEGLPIVLLEAIANGVVPIVSHLEGITDFVITDGVDGQIVPIGDVSAFADALLALVNDRNRLRMMSHAAWSTACSRFSYMVMGRTYLELARQLQEQRLVSGAKRSGSLDLQLLTPFPFLPFFMVRPVRKVLRTLGLYKDPNPVPLLYNAQASR